MTGRGRGALLCAALAALLALPLFAPLLAHPRTTLWGMPGDSLGTLAGIEAVAAWLGGAPREFRVNELQPLIDLPAALLSRWVGAVAAYNFILFASFPLAAAAAFLAACELGLSRFPAFASGLLFTFAPFHLAHAREHLDQAQTWPVALVAWAALVVARRPRPAAAIALLGTVLLAGLVNAYLVVLTAPLALTGVLVALVGRRKGGLAMLATLVAAGVAVMILVQALWAAPLSQAWSTRARLLRERAHDAVLYSARPAEYLRPSVWHPVLGGWAGERFAQDAHGSSAVEQTLTLGFAPLLLALLGLRNLWRIGGDQRLGALMLLCAGLMALWFSLPPWWGASGWLFHWLPWFRAVARFGMVTGFATALLAGAGLRGLGRGPTVLLLALAAFEFADRPTTFALEPVEARQWLAREAAEVADFPSRPWRQVRQWRPLAVRHRGVEELEAVDAVALPSLATAERLRGLGVSHIVLHDDAAADPGEGFRLQAVFRGARIYEITADPPPVLVVAREGFGPPEGEGKRWMTGERAQLELRATGGCADYQGELSARLPVSRALSVMVGAADAESSGAARGVTPHESARSLLLSASVGSRPLSVVTTASGRRGQQPPGELPSPLALFQDMVFSPTAWSCEWGSIGIAGSFGVREPGDLRWLGDRATIQLRPSAGVTRLSFEVRTLNGERTLLIRRCGAGSAGCESVPTDHLAVTDQWQPVELEVGEETLDLDAGQPQRIASDDPRTVSVATRRLRLLPPSR